MSARFLSHHHDSLLSPPSVTLQACTMSYDDNSDVLSLDSPGHWETEAEELCQALNIGTPEYVLGSSQRGAHTAWGYAVKLQETFTPPRYWYSWENRHNAKEATAEGLVKNIYKHYYGSESGPSVQKSKKRDGGSSLPRNKKSK